MILKETITRKGANMSVSRAGTGRKLLFLHGAGGAPDWLPIFDNLSEKFEVIVPEHPGFGDSDTPDWLVGINDMAMYYLDFIESISDEPIDVVASSLGGWIAAEVAIRNPSLFRSLTLIAPAGLRIKGIRGLDTFFLNNEEHARALFVNQAYADVLLTKSEEPERQDAILKNRFTTARLSWQPRGYNPDLERWLERITVPVQLIWGEEDQFVPFAYAQAWLDKLPDARLRALPHTGHLPHIEQYATVADHVATFHSGV